VLDIRKLTGDFSVAPQIDPADVAELAASGFRTLICNRPDEETSAGLSSRAMAAAAEAAGLAFINAPFAGAPSEAALEAVDIALAGAAGPVLAYCRSGTRSATAFAIAGVRSGRLEPDSAIGLARTAGYDLSGLGGFLDRIRPRRAEG